MPILIITLLLIVFFTVFFITKLIDTITSSKAPAIATPTTALEQIRLALEISTRDEVWEVGCGDGKVISYCANKHPGCQFIGIENGIQMYLKALWRTYNQPNVRIIFGNFKKTPPNNATKIYLYLLPETLREYKKLIPKKATVISLEFKIPSLRPYKTISLKQPTKLAHKLFLYKF